MMYQSSKAAYIMYSALPNTLHVSTDMQNSVETHEKMQIYAQ